MRYLLSTGVALLLSGCMIAPFINNHSEGRMDTNTSESKGKPYSGGSMIKMNHSTKSKEHTEEHEEILSYSKSYVITERYCTQCHEMKEASLYSKEEWKPVLTRMIGYMKKTGNLQSDAYETVMMMGSKSKIV